MAEQKSPPSSKTILVVDDDDEIRQMLSLSLETEGFHVKTGRDGRNILKKALDAKPDLIITDLMMPGGGGYEVIRSLQSDDLTRKTPIYIITGNALDASTKDMMRQEPNVRGYFEKPIKPATFLDEVHKILNTKSKFETELESRKKTDPEGYDPTNFNERSL